MNYISMPPIFSIYVPHFRSDFSLKFMSRSLSRVEFQATVIGEKLADEYQVNKGHALS